MANQTKEERRATLGGGGKTLIGSALFALLWALLIGGGLLLTAALIFSLRPEWTPYIGTVGCAIGAFSLLLGGFFAGRRQKHTGALVGLVCGLLYLCVLLLIARFWNEGASLPKRLIGYAIFLLLSVLGGALGGMRISKRRHTRKKR